MLSRRTLLAAGAAGFLAACGSSTAKPSPAASDSTSGTAVADLSSLPVSNINLVARFPSQPIFVPGRVRLAVSLGSSDGILKNVPDRLVGEIVDDHGRRIDAFRAPVRKQSIPVPYFAPTVTIPSAGTYTIRVDVGGKAEASVAVFDPAKVQVPHLGGTLPGFDTPTVDDHRGVDPICTLDPGPCPFHAQTLTQALASGKPVVYMVGTPAHCSTGACAPGLQFLVDASKNGGPAARFAVVHTEVYTDNLASTVTPAVQALQVDYEPIVFVTDASGTIVHRLDAVWDPTELGEVLAAVS